MSVEDEDQIDQWVREFGSNRPQLKLATRRIQSAVVARLEDVGIRVLAYLDVDVHRAIGSLDKTFTVLERVNKTAEQKERGEFGYCGQHLILRVDSNALQRVGVENEGQRFEVQFRTILQHDWAEFEHDIRYKGSTPAPPIVNRAFTLASALIELTDKEFGTINEVVAKKESEDGRQSTGDKQRQITGRDLRVLLEGALPRHPRSRAEDYKWMAKLLRRHRVLTTSQAAELLATAEWDQISRKLNYQSKPGHIRALDDFLLMNWGRRYIDASVDMSHDANRRDKLKFRLACLIG
ncbi:GTP pyrophosphokinase (plasmid) [Pseudarthrobacter sp. P1]|uniref:GTP pyrophosphokinase n=1 Tax=Pseudarthrobacter sp. P1 TaxID=3418418 RepID=UPI003CED17DD